MSDEDLNSAFKNPTKTETVAGANRLNVRCFACGHRSLTRSEDKKYHHRKLHVQSNVKFVSNPTYFGCTVLVEALYTNIKKKYFQFTCPTDVEEANRKAEIIFRFLLGYGERLIDEDIELRNLDFLSSKVGAEEACKMAEKDLEAGIGVIYFACRPPFFVKTPAELKEM